MDRCIAEVRTCATWNFLKLNGSKTKRRVVGAKWQLTKAAVTDISFGEWVKPAIQIATNIEGMMDLKYRLQARGKHRVSVSLLTYYLLTYSLKHRKYLVVKTTSNLSPQSCTTRMDYSMDFLHVA